MVSVSHIPCARCLEQQHHHSSPGRAGRHVQSQRRHLHALDNGCSTMRRKTRLVSVRRGGAFRSARQSRPGALDLPSCLDWVGQGIRPLALRLHAPHADQRLPQTGARSATNAAGRCRLFQLQWGPQMERRMRRARFDSRFIQTTSPPTEPARPICADRCLAGVVLIDRAARPHSSGHGRSKLCKVVPPTAGGDHSPRRRLSQLPHY